MSLTNIRAALETAVDAMTPPIATAWENRDFTPPAASVPYQRVYVLLAEPDNIEFGPGHICDGFLQLNLLYPRFAGTRDSMLRCDLLRSVFSRGTSLTYPGGVVNIMSTPDVRPGTVDGDRFSTTVKIRFSTFIS